MAKCERVIAVRGFFGDVYVFAGGLLRILSACVCI